MGLGDKVESFINKSDDGEDLNVDDAPQQEEDDAPQYRMIGDDKIPVSKKYGKIWESRKKSAFARLQTNGDIDRWDTAIDYYRADQITERRANADESRNETGTRLTSTGKETENIVFANATALVPALYAKNPKCEVNVEPEELKEFAHTLKHLVNVLIAKKCAPGVNLKPKARRSVLMAVLTNYAYAEVGYTRKEDASETTLVQLQQLAQQLAKAKSKKVITQIEGKLQALEDKVDLLRPEGPWVKFRRPHDVLVDPDADTLDDARWIMIADYLDTEFLKAVYGQNNSDDEQLKSIYEPTHVLKLDGNDSDGVDDDIANFSIFDTTSDRTFKDYGFNDEDSFKKAQRTKVWYVWDKATRRVYLFSEKDWKWPLWVWDDLYEFDDFFPIVPLEFYTDPTDYTARGEVTYYIDQADALNKINNEFSKVREYIVGKVIYNKNILGENADSIVDAFIDGTNSKRALGLNLPPDTDLSKAFAPMVPQSAHALQTAVFDKQRIMEAIDRVSSVTNVMRGVEFKTNTTNQAIESYNSNTQTRLDEKTDQVEDFIGDIAWKIAQLCCKFMDAETVGKLIGQKHAQVWQQFQPASKLDDLKTFASVSVVGGSAQKSTSAQKKQQAAQLGQILGQFARATPAALIVALKVMQEAYDELIITPEEWSMIIQSIQAQMQQGQQQQGQAPQQPQPQGQKKPGAEGEQPQQDQGANALAQVEQIIDSLPPPVKKELGSLISADIPIKQALATVIQDLQQVQQQQAGPQLQ